MLLREARSDTKYAELVDYSERTAMFRIKVADLTNFPNDVEKALRNLKINRFGIFKGQKARVSTFVQLAIHGVMCAKLFC
jgi:hypothetical protein